MYGVAVVFAAAFWLKSTNTLPGRSARLIRCTTRSGSSFSASTASVFAYADTRSEAVGSTGTSRCSPLDPDVFPYASSPSAASRSRSQRATVQHSTTVAGAPGSRSNTIRSAVPGASARHCGVWNSTTRLAAHISEARSWTTTWRACSFSWCGTGAVCTQDGVPGGGFLVKNNCPSGPSG